MAGGQFFVSDFDPPESGVSLESLKGIGVRIAVGDEGSLCANNTLPCTPIRLIKATIEGQDYEPEQYYFNDDKKYHFKLQYNNQLVLEVILTTKKTQRKFPKSSPHFAF